MVTVCSVSAHTVAASTEVTVPSADTYTSPETGPEAFPLSVTDVVPSSKLSFRKETILEREKLPSASLPVQTSEAEEAEAPVEMVWEPVTRILIK